MMPRRETRWLTVRGGPLWVLALLTVMLAVGTAGSAPAAARPAGARPAGAAASRSAPAPDRAARAAASPTCGTSSGGGPDGSTLIPSCQYCPGVDPGGSNGDLMDIYIPAGATTTSHYPTLVYVHGGGWEMGNAGPGGKLGGYALAVATALLTDHVVAAVDYRLADPNGNNPPKFQFPDQIIDVKCAIRFLRQFADAFNVDTAHVVAMGESAGGHLVSLAGTAPPSAGFECQSGDTTDWCGQSSALQAVVDMWGVSDFTDATWGVHASQVIQQVFGHAPGEDNPILERASPVSYIAKGDPPFLIIQGDEDPLNTPPQGGPELAQRLALASVPVTLDLVHHAAHGAFEPGEQPGIPQITQDVVNFVEAHS